MREHQPGRSRSDDADLGARHDSSFVHTSSFSTDRATENA